MARRRSLEKLRGPVIDPYLDLAYANIEKQIEKGRLSTQDPWIPEPRGGLEFPSAGIIEAVKEALRTDGYSVVDKPDPDPGHPCSHPYTLVSW